MPLLISVYKVNFYFFIIISSGIACGELHHSHYVTKRFAKEDRYNIEGTSTFQPPVEKDCITHDPICIFRTLPVTYVYVMFMFSPTHSDWDLVPLGCSMVLPRWPPLWQDLPTRTK